MMMQETEPNGKQRHQFKAALVEWAEENQDWIYRRFRL